MENPLSILKWTYRVMLCTGALIAIFLLRLFPLDHAIGIIRLFGGVLLIVILLPLCVAVEVYGENPGQRKDRNRSYLVKGLLLWLTLSFVGFLLLVGRFS